MKVVAVAASTCGGRYCTMVDAGDVDATGGDVGGDEDAEVALAELGEGALALRLRREKGERGVRDVVGVWGRGAVERGCGEGAAGRGWGADAPATRRRGGAARCASRAPRSRRARRTHASSP